MNRQKILSRVISQTSSLADHEPHSFARRIQGNLIGAWYAPNKIENTIVLSAIQPWNANLLKKIISRGVWRAENVKLHNKAPPTFLVAWSEACRSISRVDSRFLYYTVSWLQPWLYFDCKLNFAWLVQINFVQRYRPIKMLDSKAARSLCPPDDLQVKWKVKACSIAKRPRTTCSHGC